MIRGGISNGAVQYFTGSLSFIGPYNPNIMKCYFIYDGQQQHGPFSFEELQQKGVKRETPVWKEGLTEWVNAGKLDELSPLFIVKPPPYLNTVIRASSSVGSSTYSKPVSATERAGFRIGRFLGFTGLIVVLVIAAVVIYNVSSRRNFSAGFSMPYLDPEHQTPSNYLGANGTYRSNFWGNKVILNGRVVNNASHTNYKDIVVRVTFFSATHTAVQTQDYVVYDYVPFGASKTFELKIDKPAAMVTCGLEAVGATFY
jgi:hypothetical protein